MSRRSLDRFYIARFDRWMKQRSKFAIVRYPQYPISSEDYFYSLLLLTLPHRDEEYLLNGYETAKDAFFGKERYLHGSINHIFFFTDY